MFIRAQTCKTIMYLFGVCSLYVFSVLHVFSCDVHVVLLSEGWLEPEFRILVAGWFGYMLSFY